MIRFGVLGAGRIGKVHARTIAASGKATVAYLADAMPKAAADLAAEVGAKVASVEDIIKAKDVDAILIATPTPFHAEQIEAGSNAGKAVLCEKPVSLSVARIEECLKTVEKNKTKLMIGFNRRFDPNFAALQKRLREGAVGTIEMATIISRDPGPPPMDYVKISGGLYRDMMIHDLDLARFLVGEDFITVSALGASLVDKAIGEAGDVDTAAVQMQTASGKICVITNSRRASYGYDQRIEVHGSKGMVSAENIRETTVEVATATGYTRDPLQNFFMTRYTQAYRNEIMAFVAAIQSGAAMAPSGNDGLMALRIAEAALRSSKEGKAVAIA